MLDGLSTRCLVSFANRLRRAGFVIPTRDEWNTLMAAIDKIKASVTRAEAGEDAALALLKSMAQQIRDNTDDPDALNALADDLDTHSAALASEVSTDTPAPPADTTGAGTGTDTTTAGQAST